MAPEKPGCLAVRFWRVEFFRTFLNHHFVFFFFQFAGAKNCKSASLPKGEKADRFDT